MPDLQSLTNNQLTDLLQQELTEADRLMTEYDASSGCVNWFGWDWPTFAATWPEQYAKIRAIKAEGRKRGLHKQPVQ